MNIGVVSHTVVDWYSFCRKVFVDNSICRLEKLGVPGCTVKIAEAKFSQSKTMRSSLTMMAKHFGELATIRGIITYKLSPFEQRAFAGLISRGLPNVFRRVRAKIFIVAPPLVLGYLVYVQAENEHARMMRKNPDDYKDDK